MQPGLYHWVDGVAQLCRAAPETAVRRLGQRLCLDEPLGGDPAYTDFACADLERVLDGYGDRRYRVAQLEAGSWPPDGCSWPRSPSTTAAPA
jgi:hypothetical protein